MLTPQQAFVILANLVRQGSAAYHQDYKRVTELADLLGKLITGVGAETLLANYVPRESPEALEQRLNITKLTTKPLAGSIMQPFYRPGRLDNVKRFVGYTSEANNASKRVNELEQFIGNFWGDESLEEYLAQRVPGLSFLDPNTWLLCEFGPFDSRYNKAMPYPVEVSCYDALDFSFVNNILEYLIVREPAAYITSQGVKVKANAFIMYLANDIIKLTPIEPDPSAQPSANGLYTDAELTDVWSASPTERYQVDLYRPKGKQVQAKRIGYIFDPLTKGRTFVSPLDNALPYFEKSIKRVSELDLTFILHVFPQKIFYAEACPGERTVIPGRNGQDGRIGLTPCTAGINTRTGRTCSTCKGSGVVTHKTASDALPVKMPQPGQAPTVKLDDMIVYKAPPVDLLKVMSDNIKDIESDAIKSVYNSEVLERTSGAPETATARVINKDEMYNTLAPFAKQCAALWRFFVTMIATFTDNDEGLVLVREYPKDMKLKSLAELYADRKVAVEAGVPYHMIQSIDRDIAGKMYVDNELEALKFAVKQRYTPFLGKSDEFLIFILSTNRARKLDEVLVTHGDTIFDELETEVPGIYYMTPDKQWGYIKPKIDKIIADMELAQGPSALDLAPAQDTSDETLPTSSTADAREKLRTSVGAAGIIRTIREDIAAGLISRADGVSQLKIQLGYNEQDAEALIGSVKVSLPLT
jgi:hypothetical protein